MCWYSRILGKFYFLSDLQVGQVDNTKILAREHNDGVWVNQLQHNVEKIANLVVCVPGEVCFAGGVDEI